jgi:hypothetical protein
VQARDANLAPLAFTTIYSAIRPAVPVYFRACLMFMISNAVGYLRDCFINDNTSEAEELLNRRFLRAENQGRLFKKLESGNRAFNFFTQLKLWWNERYLNKMGLLAETLGKVQNLRFYSC